MSEQTIPLVRRAKGGRFIAARCPDPNCDGILVQEGRDWICNGLTHKRDNDELEACPRWEEGP